ncbi:MULTISPECIES: SLC13 family permease [Dysgonomonas]|uniref:SLC13 family permease n=1 Tax=Dysgonomonas capnocytophagoides TaxID=45254 RepID=A0A4Y8LA83_9BACT|nr:MULTISPECIES: SLC13 family permease [Dysgonomonas]MBS7119752.1 SLC13 family permease [Dysgonomonas sp.]TFD99221.1 SLC13 family permease [Dysgonomonas capnocytophagoides]
MNITLIILLVSSIFFMQGKVRADLVAICALLALVVTGILLPSEALSGFSNPVVIMMIGLFVVGGGIFRTGLAKLISSKILRLAGESEIRLFVLVMLVTASIGAFVSNTGTVAVMMPIVVSIAVSAKVSPKRFLMPLAFASSMGILTLIATPPNMIVSNELEKNGFEALSFFSFTPVGLVCLAVGIVVLYFLSKFFLSDEDGKENNDKKSGKSLTDLTHEYQLHKLTHIAISDDSDMIGKTLRELQIPNRYNISIVTVEKIVGGGRFRKNTSEVVAGPNTTIEKGDVLVCYGKKSNISRFIDENNFSVLEDVEKGTDIFDFQEIGIAEVFIMPNSKLVNRTIIDAHFRDEFNVNILGIQRKNEYKMSDLQNEKLHSGDALLIQGTWTDIANLGDRQEDLVLVGQPLKEAAKVTINHKAPVAAVIMALMVIAMVTNIVAPVIAVMSAAVLMVITGCLRNVEEAYKNINWESVVLIAGMMPMAVAFEKTGAAALISDTLVGGLGSYGPYALLAGVYFGTSILTMFISNSATALLFAPIGIQAAANMGVSPYPFMFAVAVAASMCFASPFSTPPNALVMSAGRYKFIDYIKVGLPLQIIMGIVMILVLPLLFPF